MYKTKRIKKGDYELVFYGRSSAIMYENGKEVFHTGTRVKPNDMSDDYMGEYLDGIIKFREALSKINLDEDLGGKHG